MKRTFSLTYTFSESVGGHSLYNRLNTLVMYYSTLPDRTSHINKHTITTNNNNKNNHHKLTIHPQTSFYSQELLGLLVRSETMSSESLDVNDYANSTLSFPQKLFILLEIDTSGLIAWASHGMCFRIEDPDKFAEDIVPRYFKRELL